MTRKISILCAAVAALTCLMPAALGDTVIDASRAIKVSLPQAGTTPVAFRTPDGKEGWAVKLSNDSIPTPAYANGKILTGTGVSGHLFYALNAETGATLWAKSGRENGPTSPVVSGKYVCYNTESCDTNTRDIESGDMVWEETTGGSLLTQPVVASGMFVIPHPTMARTNQWSDNIYRMLAVDLKDGKHHWDASMTGDVTGAPISANGRLYFACVDGRLFSVDSRGGVSTWHVVANATSAPVVVGQTLAVTTEEKRMGGGATVSIRRFNVDNGNVIDQEGVAPVVVASAVDVQRVGWDYQGPKIASANRKLFNAPGQVINSVDLDTGKALWQTTIRGDGLSNASNSLTPPALGSKTLYLGSQKGHILAVKQENGMLAYAYNVGVPLLTQPLLVDGNLYFGTGNGMLVCLKMKDADAKNWTAWGGNSEHNKVD